MSHLIMGNRKRYRLQLILAHSIFNVIVCGACFAAVWLNRSSPDEDLQWLCLPAAAFAAIAFPLLVAHLGKRLHGETLILTYAVGLAFCIVPCVGLGQFVIAGLVRTELFQPKRFSTTEQVAEFYRNATARARLRTAVHLPDAAPLSKQHGTVTGIVGRYTPASSRGPRGWTVQRASLYVWPLFTPPERPGEKARKIKVHVWQGQAQSPRPRSATNWYRFADMPGFDEAVKDAMKQDERVRTRSSPACLQRIDSPQDEKYFWQRVFCAWLIAANAIPLGILAIR